MGFRVLEHLHCHSQSRADRYCDSTAHRSVIRLLLNAISSFKSSASECTGNLYHQQLVKTSKHLKRLKVFDESRYFQYDIAIKPYAISCTLRIEIHAVSSELLSGIGLAAVDEAGSFIWDMPSLNEHVETAEHGWSFLGKN